MEALHEGDDGSTDLDGDLILIYLEGLLHQTQRPEFRVVIENPELSVLELDVRMETRHRDVRDPSFALMTSTLGDEMSLRASCSYEFY